MIVHRKLVVIEEKKGIKKGKLPPVLLSLDSGSLCLSLPTRPTFRALVGVGCGDQWTVNFGLSSVIESRK